jgi:uncharacterized protein YgbK (DUF1537 family)
LLICFYGDDFTGSTAALECLSLAGVRTALFIEPPTAERLARYKDLQAVGVAGMTRAMTPEAMETILRPALSALRALGAPHVHYKVCSTFDSSPAIGSIGRVIDMASEIFGGRFVPLLVGAPVLGRYCVFGNLFARLGQEGEAFRLDRHPSMSKHPITPADESDLRLHLARQTSKKIGLFDILKIDLPLTEAKAALETSLSDGVEIVLFDVLRQEQLGRIGQLMDAYASEDKPLFSVGSSAVEEALCAHWSKKRSFQPAAKWADPGRAEPLLVASGSNSPVTQSQIAWALEHGFAEVVLDTARFATARTRDKIVRQTSASAVQQLNAGRGVIVGADPGRLDARSGAINGGFAASLGAALGQVVREVIAKRAVRRLAVAGGDTSGHVAAALGIEALEMIAPLVSGAPLCRAHAPGSPADRLEVNFKGGQIGGPSYFGTVARGKQIRMTNDE